MAQNQDECWICRRTRSELWSQVVKDKMEGYISEETLLKPIKMLESEAEKPYVKYVCFTCDYMVRLLVQSETKAMINDDVISLKFNLS